MNGAGDHVRLIEDLVFNEVSSTKLIGASGVVVMTAPFPSLETSEVP